MTRLVLLSGATVCLLVAATWRYQHVLAGQRAQAHRMVDRALHEGQRVPLEGIQEVELAGVPPVRARVTRSAEGKILLVYLSGSRQGMKIWDNGSVTWRWLPVEERLTLSACRRATQVLESKRRELLLQNFEPQLAGQETIAHVPAWVVDLRPRHPGTPWKRLWISAEGVVLASSDVGPENELLRRTRFVELTLRPGGTPPPESFEPDAELVRRFGAAQAGDSVSGFPPERLVDVVGFPLRLPTYLPAGYRFELGFPFPCSGRKQAARLQYTDGINTLMLFECGHGCPEAARCVMPADPGGVAVSLYGDGISLAAVGEVRREELDRMLRSVLHAAPVRGSGE